jgi:hypothetical protein
MNAKQAIDKIADLLGFKFKKEAFYSTKIEDGSEITNNLDSDFKIGDELYKVGESTLSPLEAGTYITREGLKLTVDTGSVIVAIESGDSANDANIEQQMTEAIDAQGQKLESNTFDVGEKVYQVSADGSKSPAPDGEHQVVLKDESGNENKIRIQVKDGIITERENVEEAPSAEEPGEQEMAAVGDPVSGIIEEPKEETEGINGDTLDKLLELIIPMAEEMKKMKSEMETMKSMMGAELDALKSDFTKFRKSPEKFSVIEKKSYKESLEDYKLDLIKAMKK